MILCPKTHETLKPANHLVSDYKGLVLYALTIWWIIIRMLVWDVWVYRIRKPS